MSAGLYVGFAGAAASKAQLESIANNVANVSTSGFRRDETRFDTVVAAALSFARVPETRIDLSPGTHRLTGNPLNAAIDGGGFFAVQGAEGAEFYTRRGDFRLDAQGRLVLPNGMPVLGQNGELAVPPGASAQLAADGTLSADGSPVGRLRVVKFEDPTALSKAGQSLIAASEAAGVTDVENPRVAIGFVEGSNVNVAAEMVALIQTSRAFEAAMRSISINDELTQSLIQIQSP
jgi:flagellar basal-body rod protein FlgF